MPTKVRKVVVNGHSGTANSATRAWQDRAIFATSTGSLWSEHTSWPGTGRLDNDERDALEIARKRAQTAGTRLYVVNSYATPIAWVWTSKRGVEHVHKVAQRFSVTTSKHQGRLY